ncbi:hypothetical protein L1887_10156 [Cichorium endivia]|nr:hypothetical protein L1887_10156 [Cichorium endivia]
MFIFSLCHRLVKVCCSLRSCREDVPNKREREVSVVGRGRVQHHWRPRHHKPPQLHTSQRRCARHGRRLQFDANKMLD